MLTGLYLFLIIVPTVLDTSGQYNEALLRTREAAMVASGAKDTMDKATRALGQMIEREADKAGARDAFIAASWITNCILNKSLSVSLPVAPLGSVATFRINQDTIIAENTWGF